MGRRKLYHTRRQNLGTFQRACDLADILEDTLKYKDADAYIELEKEYDYGDTYSVMYLCWLEEYSEADYEAHKQALKAEKERKKQIDAQVEANQRAIYEKLKAKFEPK